METVLICVGIVVMGILLTIVTSTSINTIVENVEKANNYIPEK
jgi:hypothetical protein